MTKVFFKNGCSCIQCRAGKHKPYARTLIKRVTRGARRRWNRLASEGRDEEITAVGLPYTD